LFESTGRGGFTIYPRIKGLEEYFEDSKEIIFYEHGNLDDLKQKIDHYIVGGLDREKIRLAGHQRTKREHTYVNRWSTILETLNIK
jgi:spore maturation protein CgeB